MQDTMTKFKSSTAFTLSGARQSISAMCAHFIEHDLSVTETPAGFLIVYDAAQAKIGIDADDVTIEISTDDLEVIGQIRFSLVSHLREYVTGDMPRITWIGDGADLKRVVRFETARVVHVTDVSPHMRRITFAGEDVAYLATSAHLHCKLFLPRPDNVTPEWPVRGEDGNLVFPTGDKKLDVRTYTLRQVNVAQNTFVIDFVMHGDGGPGAAWAARAQAGQEIGLTGPGGQGVAEAGWYLLAGDDTALPAIGRILSEMSPDARGVAVIEVDSVQDEQALVCPAGVQVRWCHRHGAAPGTTTLLIDSVREVTWPAPDTTVFAWVGAEFAMFRQIRDYLRDTRALDKKQYLVVGYWRRGQSA